jgi:hypothetical protein
MTRLLIPLLLGLLFAADASACNRCGLFGNKCRYSYAQKYYYPVSYAAPVVYTPPSNVQNFVFNNSYPVAAFGNSVYGYSLAAQAYSVDAGQVLDRAGRLAELAFTSGTRAIGDFNDAAGSALALSAEASRQQQNTLLALSAIQANQQPAASQSLSFKASVQNGKLSIQRIEADHFAEPGKMVQAPPVQAPVVQAPVGGTLRPLQDPHGELPPPAPGALSLQFNGLATCASCHDGTGKKDTPPGLIIDGQTALTEEQYRAAVRMVVSGKMPPRSSWSDDQKSAVLAEMARLIAR